MSLDTVAVHAGRKICSETGSVLPPIYQTTTYVLPEVGLDKGFDYSRASNPTRACLEENLAALEGAPYAVAFASGMAAVDAVIRLLSSGDHIVSVDDVYGGVSRLLNQIASRVGIEVTYVDPSVEGAIAEAIRTNTKLLWIETPTNPLLRIVDVQAAAAIAAEKGILIAVDSTFATPYSFQPLVHGADIVVHSTTKYLSGHNQIIGGACICNREDLFKELKFIQKSVGAVPSPFDCWLTLIGIKTLGLRVQRHSENASKVATWLEEHSLVSRVLYPGLSSHPQYALANSQLKFSGGMLAFELRGGYEAGVRLMNALNLASLAESLGSVETLVTHPASMTHADVNRAERTQRGLTDGLVRLSVGIEAAEDIIADLRQGLAVAGGLEKLANS